MDLASSFLNHAQRFDTSICFEYIEVNEHQRHRLSYGHAIDCYHQHVRYLYHECPKMISTVVQQPSSIPWVVAYLSHNSIDYMLSILAASSSGGSHVHHPVQLLPVLIPTKWTVQEIVQVLQIPPNDPPKLCKDITTILLFDTPLQHLAQKVQQALLHHADDSHLVQCLPLPSYAHDCIMRNERSPRLPYSVPRDLYRIDSSPSSSLGETTSLSTEDAVILFTSGTTHGQAQGVRLSHRAIYAQSAAKVTFLFTPATRLFAHTVPFYHIGGFSNYFAVWLAGGTLVMPTSWRCDNHPTPATAPQFCSPSSFDPHIIFQSWNPTTTPSGSKQDSTMANALVVVPTMLHMIQQYYEQQQHRNDAATTTFPHVQCILIGGQSARPELLRFLRRIFPRAHIVQTYACTEAASSLTFLNVTTSTGALSTVEHVGKTVFPPLGITYDPSLSRVDPPPAHLLLSLGQCVGRPPAHVELYLWKENWEEEEEHIATLIDPKSHHCGRVIQTPFTPGIIVTRGPHVMNGYWSARGSLRATSGSDEVLQHTGCMITNDMGFWDAQGRLYYLGRRTDTIRTGGETVWCTEVEQVLQKHPRVRECAVFGIADERFGEVVCCAVVLATMIEPLAPENGRLVESEKGEALTSASFLEEIRTWCRNQGLAGYKCPRHLLLLGESPTAAIPRNSNGKVLKYRLQQQLLSLLSKEKEEEGATRVPTDHPTTHPVRLQSKL